MDWDRTGGRLQRRIVDLLESFDMKVSQETRNTLMKALKPETRVVESLKGLSYALLPYIDDFDSLN
jgi:5S rRNA maturation endonuclease (ribonuclease M5)